MADLWFRARRVDEGQGYSVANWKGGAAATAFCAVALLALGAPWVADRGGPLGFAIGALLFLIVLAIFMLIVRRHSDWRG